MVEKTLQLIFVLESGKKWTLSLKNPKPSLTSQEIGNAANTIVAQNVFKVGDDRVVGIEEAKIIERATTIFEI